MSENEHKVGEGLDQPTEVIQPNSVMESLRAKHRELRESKTLDLPIPGYDGDLVARYRLLTMKELENIGNRVQKQVKNQGDRVLRASLDAIIVACEGMYYNRDGRLVPLSESISKDEPMIKYDDRLIEFLALELREDDPLEPTLGPARKTVLAVFGENDIAILDHSRAIGQWSSDTSRDVTEAFLPTH
jgi:hypothetical protein